MIGEYVLSNKDNTGITSSISAIQEGGILYTGLAYNISEFGSLKNPITLFLDTEILFDIAGLNGELYKSLATDFLDLVDSANRGGKTITLRYFREVAEDIEHYYDRAERVVEGKGEVALSHAMKAIVDGCKDVSDIAIRKTDLYRKFNLEHGIRQDDKTNYFASCDIQYNFEGDEVPNFPSDDPANKEGIKFCSNINVLRKGLESSDFFSSKYLCVTDTRRVLDISHAIVKGKRNQDTGEHYCEYAIGLSHITNLLWYKLNRGFGSTDFPRNLDAVIKARMILSAYISQGITSAYKDIKVKSANGELTSEQVAAYIVALKEKTTLPEDLNSDNVEDSLDFSEEHFNRFAETISQNARLLKERDEIIRDLSSDVENLKQQLTHANEENYEKQEQINELAGKINAIEERERRKSHKRQVAISWLLFAWSIVWKFMIVVGAVAATWYICKLLKVDFGTWLSIVIGIVSLVGMGVAVFKRDWKKHLERCDKSEEGGAS